MRNKNVSYISVLYLVLGISFFSILGFLVLLNLYIDKEIVGKINKTLNFQIREIIAVKSEIWSAWHKFGMDNQIIISSRFLLKDSPVSNIKISLEGICNDENEVCIKLTEDSASLLVIYPDLNKYPRYVISKRILKIMAILILVLFAYFCFYILRKYRKIVIDPIKNLERFAENIHDNTELTLPTFKIVELDKIASVINKLLESSKKFISLKAEVGFAKQIAHDIRSPLSALNMILPSLNGIPEEKRLLIRNAVGRINDIANELLQKGSKPQLQQQLLQQSQQSQSHSRSELEPAHDRAHTKAQLSTHLLSPLIDSIVSEKRIQFREKQNIEIEADLNQGYGLFASINASELKRVISNLVNNSVEAFLNETTNETGKVIVAIRNYGDQAVIIIQDNGKGIPEHILKKLGEMGVSHGKENNAQSGSGLGVYHAKKTVEDVGGKFQIQSREGLGTIITMTFSKAIAPQWFVEKLTLVPGMAIASLDDDISIHQIWKGRFESKNIAEFGIEYTTFTSGPDFKTWITSQPRSVNDDAKAARARLYLVDYELLNQNATGLDIIEELGIGEQAILVTSRYEEVHIRERCERLCVRLIPKQMAGFVPIEMASKE
jgi:signal transduction histidine kinase